MRKSYHSILNTEFAIQLIKNIPSNLYCGYILKVPTYCISHKRNTIPGAVRAGRYKLSLQTKLLFKPKLKELKERFGDGRIVSTTPIISNDNSITVTIDGNSVSLKDGDILETRDNKLYLLRLL